MSMIAMNATEEKQIDSQIEQMMDWAKTHQAEAEQLALDSARLMACTTDRVDRLKKQGFFKRCWNRFTGATGEMESANTGDIIQIQKKAFRYINMLQEQQLLMAHSLLALKNNLVFLAIREEETRNLVGLLAQRTQDRFELLETRTDQLEISTNLQGWLLGLEERDYDKKFPTEYMRMFRVINDFYQIKKDNWNYNDLIFMRKALRTVGIDPKSEITLNSFIEKLTEEINQASVGLENYNHAISAFAPPALTQYSEYVIENISSPVFASVHGLKLQFGNSSDIVEVLQDKLEISNAEAQKLILQKMISNMNVNMNHKFSLGETAIEIMGSIRLIEQLLSENIDFPQNDNSQHTINGDCCHTKTEDIPIEIVQVKSIGDKIKILGEITTILSDVKSKLGDPVNLFITTDEKYLPSKEKQEIKRKTLENSIRECIPALTKISQDISLEVDHYNDELIKHGIKPLFLHPSSPIPKIELKGMDTSTNSDWQSHTEREIKLLKGYAEHLLAIYRYISEIFNTNNKDDGENTIRLRLIQDLLSYSNHCSSLQEAKTYYREWFANKSNGTIFWKYNEHKF